MEPARSVGGFLIIVGLLGFVGAFALVDEGPSPVLQPLQAIAYFLPLVVAGLGAIAMALAGSRHE